MKRSTWILAALLAWAGLAVAVEHMEHPAAKPIQGDVIEATVTGKNICLACTLKKENGADAQCSRFGHRHALQVTGATVAGKDVKDFKGWTLSYLENENSQAYLTGHMGETLVLEGRIHTGARVLEVGKPVAGAKIGQPTEHPKGSEHPNNAEHPGGHEHPGGSK